MMKPSITSALVTSLVQPAQSLAAESEPRILSASTSWVLDFADERCSLIREFSDGDETMRLQIDSYGPSPGYRVMISGDLVTGSRISPITEFRVDYSPDTGEREPMSMVVGRFNNDRAVSFGPAFLPDAPWENSAPFEFERKVDHMTVEFRLRDPFRLETGNMAAPFAVMHQCEDDLIASWGIDPDEHRSRSRPPRLIDLPEGYTRVEVDFEESHPGPAERRYRAIAERQARYREGPVPRAGYVVPVRIMIDATGEATECVIQGGNADEAYRQTICERFAGPYEPALDAEGEPVASFIQLGTN